jgi:hypothetical protein
MPSRSRASLPKPGSRATSRLRSCYIPRLVADEAAAREILGQIVKQTDQFGLPALKFSHSGLRGVIAAGR